MLVSSHISRLTILCYREEGKLNQVSLHIHYMFVINHEFPLGVSQVIYTPSMLSEPAQNEMILHLKTLEWFGGEYNGRSVSRLQRWYHDDDCYFNQDWPKFKRWMPCEYSRQVRQLQSDICEKNRDINSLLINLYPTGTNVIPAHRDSEKIFGEDFRQYTQKVRRWI